MHENKFEFYYQAYNGIDDLPEDDAWLLNKAKEATKLAYAPYSNFKVGAVARLLNGEIVTGSNQENASFPVGLCAERVLLASASSLYPNVPIETIAISYQSGNYNSNHPVAPCGLCRQALNEYGVRVNQTIRLILAGMEGKIFIIPDANMLLPLAFSSNELR